jgi:hypothetical protein
MILYDLYWWKYELNGLKTVTFCVSFEFLTMFYSIVGAGAVGAGAGATSRYGSGSGSGFDQKMWLLAAPAPQHWYLLSIYCRYLCTYCITGGK